MIPVPYTGHKYKIHIQSVRPMVVSMFCQSTAHHVTIPLVYPCDSLGRTPAVWLPCCLRSSGSKRRQNVRIEPSSHVVTQSRPEGVGHLSPWLDGTLLLCCYTVWCLSRKMVWMTLSRSYLLPTRMILVANTPLSGNLFQKFMTRLWNILVWCP